MEDWIVSALSGEQRQVFARKRAHACVLAAAGSGKTRTLVHLLAADLAAGVPPAAIVAFTFTEKAAEELLARVHVLARKRLPAVDLTGMYIGTIHAWCLEYLTQQSDFYNFTSLDELHVDALTSRLYDYLGLQSAYGEPYPKAIGTFLADLEVFYNEHLELEDVPARIRPSLKAFLLVLQENRLITFGGMVRHATEHLQARGPVRRLRSLYLDEYQDVNPAQVALIKAMVPAGGKVVVVGDDLQCIYNWRGSDVTRILNFTKEFKDASVFRLSTNYRARPRLVEIGNHIAEHVTLRDPEKIMQAARDGVGCEVVHWFSLDSEEEQAAALPQIVERLAANGVPWKSIAVLLRSVTGSGTPFVEALTARGIPVQCPLLSRGGDLIDGLILPLFDWLRQDHREARSENEERAVEGAADALWSSVCKWIPGRGGEVRFWESLTAWARVIEEQRSDAYDVRGRLYEFLDRCGVRLRPDDHNLMVGLGIASQIIRSVEEIHRRRIRGQQRRSPRRVMAEVYFALLRNKADFGESVPIDATADGVLITTVHQAKGLEWPVVIIPMLVDRRFPVSRRPHKSSFPQEIAGRYGTTVEDERRLFYVAATRAKERLFLLDPVRQKGARRSVFLRELEGRRMIEVSNLSDIEEAVWTLTEEELKPSDPAPLRVALSDLLLYLECPYQYGLRRVVAVQPSVGEELGFGKGLHELIQRRLEARRPWSPSELRQQVQEHVRLPYMSQQGEERARQAIEGRLRDLERLGMLSAEVEPEVPVEVLFTNGLVYGTIDGIQPSIDGSVRVRDWKSNVHKELLPRYQKQLQFYSHASRLQGRKVNGAEVVDVAASAQRRMLVGFEVDVREETGTELLAVMEGALQGISQGKFPARPAPDICACCDVYRICAVRHEDASSQ